MESTCCQQEKKKKKKKKKKIFRGWLVTWAKSALGRVAAWSRCAFERNCFDVGIARANLHAGTVRATPRAHLAVVAIFCRAHAHIRLAITRAPSRHNEHRHEQGDKNYKGEREKKKAKRESEIN
jgi:hypothetical protein